MSNKNKEKRYLIRWNNDGEMDVVSIYQLEAIRHSERKHYDGVPALTVIREATEEDIAFYTHRGMQPQAV